MGLEMYLTKKRFLWTEERKGIVVTLNGNPLEGCGEVEEIKVRSAYWRKANQIHKWFVKNVQSGKDDCGTYNVSKEQLETLLATCKEVQEDHSKAGIMLPPQSGFFFGSTDLDEWYFRNIDDTVDQLGALVFDDNWEYQYQSSW